MSDTAPVDPRPVWNPQTALPAVESMFETMVQRLGPGAADHLDEFLAPLVEGFDAQVRRLRQQHRALREQIDGMAESPAGLTHERRQALLGEADGVSRRQAAFVQLRQAAAEQYLKHVGRPWDVDAALNDDEIPHDTPAAG